MNKIKLFFYTFRKTFTSIDYYKEILEVHFSFSLKFYLFFFFLYAIIGTIVFSVLYALPLNSFFTNVVPSELLNIYPDELEITLRDGGISTNVDEPFFIPLSSFDTLREKFEEQVLGLSTENLNNLIVIDTQARIEDFPQYNTVALLTKNHLSIINDDGNLETISLTDLDNFVLDKAVITGWMNIVSPYFAYIIPILISIFFTGVLLFMPIYGLLYLLFFALVLKIISQFMSRTLRYSKAYQLGLHFFVISITFFSLWSLIGIELSFPYLQTILLSILGVIVIRHNVKPSSSRSS